MLLRELSYMRSYRNLYYLQDIHNTHWRSSNIIYSNALISLMRIVLSKLVLICKIHIIPLGVEVINEDNRFISSYICSHIGEVIIVSYHICLKIIKFLPRLPKSSYTRLDKIVKPSSISCEYV